MQEHVCHIWVGQFAADSPETYFVQEYVDDESPQSQFAAQQGEICFDYDVVEISFPNDPVPVRDFVGGHSYSEFYLHAVVQKAAELGVTEANVFVLANKDQFAAPRSVAGPGYKLWYLGEFACR